MLIPNDVSEKIILNLHRYIKHPGELSLYLTLKNYIKIQNIKENNKLVTSSCLKCKVSKNIRSNYRLQTQIIKANNFLDIAVRDITDPIETQFFISETNENNKFWILATIDIKTRWVETKILVNIGSNTIASASYQSWLKRVGIPKKLISYRGT